MNQYVTGAVIKELREKNKMTLPPIWLRKRKPGGCLVSGMTMEGLLNQWRESNDSPERNIQM